MSSSLTKRRRNRTYIDNFATKKEDGHAPGLSTLIFRRRASLHSRPDSYFICGRKERWQKPEIEYNVYILRFIVHEEFDPILVPNEELSQTFRIPSEMVVKCVTSRRCI
jgi:hypothetical protein